ncbi:MAG: MBL fold metallo-hydrolase [Desulfobacteraceae bacterium]|nr:MBL fold metallo-hydrolase [Desulfobacteraceae bacterium]
MSKNTVSHNSLEPLKNGKYDIGQCKSVKIKCVSEIGWFDDEKLMNQVLEAGGLEISQWTVPWDKDNAAGSCSLVEMESTDGTHHKFLLDTGWNPQYMDECFKREGIDKMLENGEIEFVFISHEHMDHLWGLEAVLKYNPGIKIFIPGAFYPEGIDFIRKLCNYESAEELMQSGQVVQSGKDEVFKLYDGCAAVFFDLPVILRIQGEQSLYFNIKDKGIVCVTGCCHQSILNFADFAQEKIEQGENMYGAYGGFHIAPFGPMDADRENVVKSIAKYNFKKIACNHCTGLPAVEKMIEMGYPIVSGTGRLGSKTDLHIGNGDEVVFD